MFYLYEQLLEIPSDLFLILFAGRRFLPGDGTLLFRPSLT